MTTSTDTIERARAADLLQLAEQRTELRRESSTEYSGPCPRCGGRDRFHVDTRRNWFFCRQCYGPENGQPHDAIAFLQWLDGLAFQDAVKRLTGGQAERPAQPRRRPARTVARRQARTWQARANRLLKEAQERIWGDAGKPGQDYLLGRGLDPHTWLTYGLGFVPESPTRERSPAIVLPWYRGGRLAAIRFRNIESRGPRLRALAGSTFAGLLYGGQALERHNRTLILCEGEINAMSIWQVGHNTGLDVLSLGSESARLSPAAVEFARGYHTTIAWLDRPELATSVAAALPGSAAIASPGGQDANDMLQAGKLGGFLSMARLRACYGDGYRLERLLWDLWDAARFTMDGIDTGTAHVVQYLAGQLGRQAKIEEVEPNRWIAKPSSQDVDGQDVDGQGKFTQLTPGT